MKQFQYCSAKEAAIYNSKTFIEYSLNLEK